jgi:hypothetical protein
LPLGGCRAAPLRKPRPDGIVARSCQGRDEGSSVMSEVIGAFTIGWVECRVLPDGIMAYEPESLYAGLSPEDTGPAVSPLLHARGLLPVPYHPLLVQC